VTHSSPACAEPASVSSVRKSTIKECRLIAGIRVRIRKKGNGIEQAQEQRHANAVQTTPVDYVRIAGKYKISTTLCRYHPKRPENAGNPLQTTPNAAFRTVFQ
jgi:hypothetical protein